MTTSKDTNKNTRNVLVIAGYDPSAGAGLLRDISTINDHGLYASGVVTVLTAQNSEYIRCAFPVPPEMLRYQTETLFEDYEYAACKIGVLGNKKNAEIIADILDGSEMFVTLDPVFSSSSGSPLADEPLIEFIKQCMTKKASLITPNVEEAERLCGFRIATQDDLEKALTYIGGLGADHVLIKGVRLEEDRFTDALFSGAAIHMFKHAYLDGKSMRGTGCTLASALTANIALGYDVVEAADKAIAYTQEAIQAARQIGRRNPQAHGTTYKAARSGSNS